MDGRLTVAASLVGAVLILIVVPGAGRAQDDLCLDCHDVAADPTAAEEGYGIDGGAWRASIHAEAGFACADCHEGKEDYPHPATEPASCTDCHDDAADDFARGLHEIAALLSEDPEPMAGHF